jgi:hypothetical protein
VSNVPVRKRGKKEIGEGLIFSLRYEPALGQALFNVLLKSGKLAMFTRSDTAFSCFLGLFYAVNHDLSNLRLKTRENVLSFEESFNWPFVGINQLLSCLVHEAPAELYARNQDIIINLHLTVSAAHAKNTDKFRLGIANMIFDMLAEGSKDEKSKSTRWIDRLVSLLKSLVVLTKPKEEVVQVAAGAGGAAGAAGGTDGFDEEEDKKKPELYVATSDKEKVQSFLEMMGEGFPEEYRYIMSALLVKEANWNVEMAINDYLVTDQEAKTAQMLEKAKSYRRYVKEDDRAKAAAPAAAAAVPEGTPVAKLVAQRAQNYDTLFALLESARVDREAIWALLKMLPPDARLTRMLSQEQQEGAAIDWAAVLGDRASYHLLYSLELVRLSVPSEENSEDEYIANTEWCRAFVHRGGFSYLFVLLKQIARVEERGRIEKACLGQLLKIVFYFMRSELDASLAKSTGATADGSSMLYLSQSSTNALVRGAPFEDLGVLMFELLSERSKKRDIASAGGGSVVVAVAPAGAAPPAGAPGKPEDADEADVARYAAYLLAGAIVKEPQLLRQLGELPHFAERLCGILCAHDATLRQHVLAQVLYLCREYSSGALSLSASGLGHLHPVPFFMGHALSFIPRVLVDDAEKSFSRCSPVFSVVCELLPRLRDEELDDTVKHSISDWIAPPSGSASASVRLVEAVCRAICDRAGREVGGAFGIEDQALSGLYRLASALLERSNLAVEVIENLARTLLEDHLFEKGSGTRCSTPATREAAFVLLQKLARRSVATWELVVGFLSKHHLSQEPVSSWRPVEVIESKRTRFVGLRNLGAT